MIIVYLFVRVIQTVVAGARVGIRGFFLPDLFAKCCFFSFSFFVVCQDHVRAEGKFSLVGGLGVRGVTQIRALIAPFHWLGISNFSSVK